MSLAPLPEQVDGLPNLCGAEAQGEEVTRQSYRNALYHLLLSESSAFRCWGQGF